MVIVRGYVPGAFCGGHGREEVCVDGVARHAGIVHAIRRLPLAGTASPGHRTSADCAGDQDRKSTRLNSSHGYISYAVFCLKKKKNTMSSRHFALLLHLSLCSSTQLLCNQLP